ncbi:MAG: hypothetical protein K8R77_07835 [Anaerolineaceae bacterium]|nr:hypothetical protein [Anaerolineaceae bacterium]
MEVEKEALKMSCYLKRLPRLGLEIKGHKNLIDLLIASFHGLDEVAAFVSQR